MVKFIFGKLTEEDEFFDREDYVSLLLNFVSRRQPVALLVTRPLSALSLVSRSGSFTGMIL